MIECREEYKFTGVNLKLLSQKEMKGILISDQGTGREIATLIIDGNILTGVPSGIYEDKSMPGCFFEFPKGPIDITEQPMGMPDIAFMIASKYLKENNLLGEVNWTNY